MRAVESADAAHMRDTGFSELLDDLNRKHRQARMATMLPAGLGDGRDRGSLPRLVQRTLVVGHPRRGDRPRPAQGRQTAWATGRWLDSYRRVTVMAYDLDEPVTRAYEAMANAFATLAASGKKFRVDAGAARSTT